MASATNYGRQCQKVHRELENCLCGKPTLFDVRNTEHKNVLLPDHPSWAAPFLPGPCKSSVLPPHPSAGPKSTQGAPWVGLLCTPNPILDSPRHHQFRVRVRCRQSLAVGTGTFGWSSSSGFGARHLFFRSLTVLKESSVFPSFLSWEIRG